MRGGYRDPHDSLLSDPKLGGVQTVVLPVLGQILMGLTIDNFGLFYSQQTSLTAFRIAGAVLVLLGVVLVSTAKESKAERKSVYRDIESLREFGLDIQTFQRAPLEYALVTRSIELDDLMLIVDAVQSSRHLTQRKSDALVRSIKRLAPKRERDLLDRHLSVSGRIKIQGDSLLYNVDRILEAIAGKRKVSFRYFSYNAAKEKVMRRSGERYVETPVEIIVNQGVYYLVTYNPETDNFEGFRVGRMDYVEVSEERAAKVPRQSDFSVERLDNAVVGAAGGAFVDATLIADGHAMNAVVDRFGRDVASTDLGDGTARIEARIEEGPAFYGWLVRCNGTVRIKGPESLAESYKQYLRAILEQC